LRKTGIWLDVGFGNASLLLTAAEFGFAPVGFDLRQRNVDALRALGIQALKADITEATLNPKASVISMCDVLEHTRFPIPVLQAAAGVPTGIRTPVIAVKGRCPRPLDDGDCVLQFGGGKRDRTADLLHAMQALSQLSYTPGTKERAL
jgi:hypothetical protein